MLDWLTQHKIPLGVWLRDLVNGLTTHAQGFFDTISLVLGGLIDGLTAGLSMIPPLVFILLVAAGAWLLHRSIALAAFVILSLLLIVNLGYWNETIQTLSLVFCATLVCVVIGVPLGSSPRTAPGSTRRCAPFST